MQIIIKQSVFTQPGSDPEMLTASISSRFYLTEADVDTALRDHLVGVLETVGFDALPIGAIFQP
jgi:hypothetical protein